MKVHESVLHGKHKIEHVIWEPGFLWAFLVLYLLRESLLFQLCFIQFMNELIKLKAHDLSESIEVSRATL